MFAHLQVHMQMENHYSFAHKGASYKEVHIYGIFQDNQLIYHKYIVDLLHVKSIIFCLICQYCTMRNWCKFLIYNPRNLKVYRLHQKNLS